MTFASAFVCNSLNDSFPHVVEHLNKSPLVRGRNLADVLNGLSCAQAPAPGSGEVVYNECPQQAIYANLKKFTALQWLPKKKIQTYL